MKKNYLTETARSSGFAFYNLSVSKVVSPDKYKALLIYRILHIAAGSYPQLILISAPFHHLFKLLICYLLNRFCCHQLQAMPVDIRLLSLLFKVCIDW